MSSNDIEKTTSLETQLVRFDSQLRVVSASRNSIGALARSGALFSKDTEGWHSLMRLALKGERISSDFASQELSFQTRDWMLFPEFNENGQVSGISLLICPTDQPVSILSTLQGKAESELSEQIGLLVRHADFSIILHDVETNTQSVIAGRESLLQLFPGMTVDEARAQIHSAADIKLLKEAQLHPGTEAIVSAVVPGSEGERRWNQFSFSPIFDYRGRKVQLLYRLGVDRMMEAQSSLEQALRFANIETFEEDAETGEGRYLFGFGDWTGMGFVGGEERLNRIPPSHREIVREAIGQVGKRVEFPFFHADGEDPVWWEQQTIREYRDSSGRRMLVGMSRCIDEEKSAQLAREQLIHDLEHANAAALAAAQSKSDFLANMSHEIRTPLHAVLGLAQVLLRTDDIAVARGYGEKIVRAGNSLQNIINDILDFSKIDAGKLEIDHQPFALQDVLDNLSVIMAKAASEKDISLAIGLKYQPEHRLIGDRLRLEQVLINLLGNAVKFTEKGHVVLEVERLEQIDSRVKLRFRVEDTGIGMSSDALKKIFSAFEQADTSTTRRFGGTGLGLTISSRLLDLMGGVLEVESAENAGSTFWFELEFDLGEPIAKSYLQLDDLSVLIAEADPRARDALRSTVQALGWQTECCASGAELLALVRAYHNRRHTVDMVLVDGDVLGGQDLELAQQLKASSGTNGAPLIMMVTPKSRDRLRCHLDSPFVDLVLEKPITTSDLFDAIMTIRGSEQDSPTQASQNLALSGVNLLIVDDNEFNREVAAQVFGSEGAKVVCLNDGDQAVRWLAANHQFTDLVLMDIQMPILDGLSATRKIRTELGLDIPIIALSAAVFDKDRDAATASGMDAFISKPFDVDRAIETILSVLQSRAPASVGSNTPLSVRLSEGGSPLFDRTSALAYWGSMERLEPYLVKFLSEHQNTVSDFDGLIDPKEIERMAHKLKGTASALGLVHLNESAQQLMKSASGSNNRLEIEDDLSLLKSALIASLEEVRGVVNPEH